MPHTPGPWRVAPSTLAGRYVKDPLDRTVATVSTTGNREPERLANARLIAQAPAMLVLLRLYEAERNERRSTLYRSDLDQQARAILRAVESGG